MPPVPTDRDALADFLATGSDAAFSAIVERHYPMVLGVCRRIAGEADAEDAAQAAFLVLASHARRVAGREDVGGWLHHVARHVALRVRASEQARRQRERAAAPPVAVEDPIDHGIDEALAALPERYRAPLVLYYFEGLSCAEVADRLRVRADNIAVRLSRGRQLLQRRLVRQGVAPAIAITWLGGSHASAASAPAGLAGGASAVAAGNQAAAAGALPTATALMESACRAMLVARAAAAAAMVATAGALGAGVLVAPGALAADPPEPRPLPRLEVAAPRPDDVVVTTFHDGLVELRRPRWLHDLEARLGQRVTFSASDQPLRSLIEGIARQTGQPIRIADGVGAAADVPITLKVRDMRATDALRWIGELSDLSFPRRDGSLWLDHDATGWQPDEVVYRLDRLVPEAAGLDDAAVDELMDGMAHIVRSMSPEVTLERIGDGLHARPIGYPSHRPVDESLLVLARDRGRGGEAGVAERRWRAERRRIADWRIDGVAVAAVLALQQQGRIDIVLAPPLAERPPGARCQWSARATVDEAVREVARQLGVQVGTVFASQRNAGPRDDESAPHWVLTDQHAYADARLRVHDLDALGLRHLERPLYDRASALGMRGGWAWNGLLALHGGIDRHDAFEQLIGRLRSEASRPAQLAAIAGFGAGLPVGGYWPVPTSEF